MSIIINRLRISFVWFEPFDGLIPLTAPLAYLADEVRYKNNFSRLKRETNWRLPWIKGERQSFWEYYLDRVPLQNITAATAWKSILPVFQPLGRTGQIGYLEWLNSYGLQYAFG